MFEAHCARLALCTHNDPKSELVHLAEVVFGDSQQLELVIRELSFGDAGLNDRNGQRYRYNMGYFADGLQYLDAAALESCRSAFVHPHALAPHKMREKVALLQRRGCPPNALLGLPTDFL